VCVLLLFPLHYTKHIVHAHKSEKAYTIKANCLSAALKTKSKAWHWLATCNLQVNVKLYFLVFNAADKQCALIVLLSNSLINRYGMIKRNNVQMEHC